MSDAVTPSPNSGDPVSGSRWSKPGHVTIRCRRDGPLVIELPEDDGAAAVRVIDHEGGEFPLPTNRRAVALCRCGASKTKPFCDGSHRDAGFRADDLAVK
jgi:CDGSH-type Zn-finger protein